MKLKLTLACGLYDRTMALQTGSVTPDGIDLNYLIMNGPGELLRRQARYAEFDVSEFSLSTLAILHSRGDHRMIGIPVFPSRKFRHSDIYINTSAGIREPKDLVGKKVGALSYQQTAAVWIRGVLDHDYGVPADQVEWHFGGYNEPMNYTERIPITLPPNVRTKKISDRSLNEMLESGEISALIGSSSPRSFQNGSPKVARLFPNYREVELDYFQRTGIFPIMHVVVIKRKIYEKSPWVAVSLYKAFARAKSVGMRRLEYSATLFCSLPWLGLNLQEIRTQMGNDPFQYGVEENRKVLETLLEYSYEQGLVSQRLKLEELFAPETLSSVDLTEI